MSSARKTQILNESIHLFSAQGYDSVTMGQIALACGITEPALYRHFKSKECLYSAALKSVTEKLDNERLFKNLANTWDLESLLKSLAEHILRFYTKHTELYRLLLRATLNGHPLAKQVYSRIRGECVQFLAEQLDRLYEAKLIVKKNNEITARCFVGMVFDCSLGATLWRGFQGQIFKPAELIANNIPIYVRGLTSQTES